MWDKEHRAYNEAVKKIIDDEGIPPSKWSQTRARDLIRRVVAAEDPAIRNYLDKIANAQRAVKTPTNWRKVPKGGLWTVVMPSNWHFCQLHPSAENCNCKGE